MEMNYKLKKIILLKLSTLVIMLFIIISQAYFKVPNPALLCAIGVVYATFIGGYIYGIINTVIAWIYCMYFFSEHNKFIMFSDTNKYKLLIIIISFTATVLMVGILKNNLTKKTTELRNLNEKLYQKTIMDELTEIYNYRFFINLFETEWEKALKEKKIISLLMIDIDFFKNYNDFYGHNAGNETLKEIAKILKSNIEGENGFAARYGGEEFVVVLKGADINESGRVSEEIRKSVEMKQIEHKKNITGDFLTISIGFSSIIPNKNILNTDLIKRADQALYQAKNSGKNKVCMFKENI